MEVQLEKSKKMRSIMRSNITKQFKKLETEIDSAADKSVVLENLEQMLAKAEDLNRIDKEIEDLVNIDSLEDEINSRESYREKIITWKLRAKRYLNEFKEKISTENNSSEKSESSMQDSTLGFYSKNHVKLPRLTLESFSGKDVSSWPSFWARFESAVHKNENLDNVEKFNYLKSVLNSDAEISIRGLTLTSDNYLKAVKILEDRFGRKEIIIDLHINNLLNLTPVRKSYEVQALRKLYDCIEVNIRGLESLEISPDSYSCLLFPIIMKAIPSDLALEFNRKSESNKQSQITNLINFLKTEIESRERTSSLIKSPDSYSGFKNAPIENKYNSGKYNDKFKKRDTPRDANMPTASALNTSCSEKCIFCAGDHASDFCSKSISERKLALKRAGRCFLCLRKYHMVRACEAHMRCLNCKRKHNKLICENNEITPVVQKQDAVIASVSEITQSSQTILLQTLRLTVKNKENERGKIVRCLFDLGSQRTFITQNLCEKLKLPILGYEEIQIFAFGKSAPIPEKIKRVQIVLQNLGNRKERIKIEALVTPVITATYLPVPNGKILDLCARNGIEISDKIRSGTEISEIALLIGSDFYWKIATGKIRRLSSSLVAVETRLGWTISGTENYYTMSGVGVNTMTVSVNNSEKIDNDTTSALLRSFWELDSLGILTEDNDNDKIENDLILANLRKSIKFENGRYIVKYPWNHNAAELSHNLEIARSRFKGLVRRFKHDPQFYDRYKNVIDQYLLNGIAEKSNFEISPKTYFMPHQAVIREDKDTTKLRIVFDASSHGKNTLSLNDCLNTGPNMYPDVLELLLRFRLNKVAFTADIEKAFLQISLAKEDRNALKFLWIKGDLESDDIEVLRMTRVIFGAKSSPFLLGATLKFHIEKFKSEYSKAVSLLEEGLYVDDLISGTERVCEALEESRNIKSLLKKGNFNMRKWRTNEPELQIKWYEEEGETSADTATTKVLGYIWNRNNDTLAVEVQGLIKEVVSDQDVTKREILRNIGRLYDPIGFLNPFTIRAKILLQEMWEQGAPWDAQVPSEIFKNWKKWSEELPLITRIEIPRHYFESENRENLKATFQLHCFTDASQKAYGSVLYLRYEKDKRINTSFVASKVRVAPLKKLTLPRLELMAALVGSRLVKFVQNKLHDIELTTKFWTDSRIVCYWINSEPKKWKPFVQNRVLEIHKNSERSSWKHCPGSKNPADLLTRGEKVADLEKGLWWSGPKWLRECEDHWPTLLRNTEIEIEDPNIELRKTWMNFAANPCVTQPLQELFDIQRYSNLHRVYRITAWCLRFVHNLRNSEKYSGQLEAAEVETAEVFWLKRTQDEHFRQEIMLLKDKIPIPVSSKIQTLNPFLDELEVLRVGGRLQYSDLEYQQKHPILLPERSHLVDLIVFQCHKNTGHGGVADTLSEVREKFWLIKSRRRIKSILHNCNICKKFRAKPVQIDMAPLPPDRCQEAYPFQNTGIDYAGPLYFKQGNETAKAYILLFTCAVTRSVHLELTLDMSAATFLLAFRKFIARRGLCKIIFSDNAKTFKKAKSDIDLLFKTMKQKVIEDYLCKEGIKWKFIAERAAWWGGFWERLVRSLKTCLRKNLGKSSLTFPELETVVIEVEAILNSRPLTFVYSDLKEPEPLTPGHFLIGRRLLGLPNLYSNVESTKFSLTRRLKHQQLLTERIWKRWQNSYLMDLRSAHHTRVTKDSSNLKNGDVVLIREDHLPRLMWKMGLITEVYQGRDGKVRSCNIRLPSGTLIKRPVQLLFPLELDTQKDGPAPFLSGPEDVAAPDETDGAKA